jgi:hypothetical protein
MNTESTRPASWWRPLIAFPTHMLAALADRTRDWRRGCGL